MTKITISVRKHFTFKEIADLIYSMAQGSGYWCKYAGDLGYETTVKEILNGKPLKLEDFEDETARYELSLAKIKKGLTLMAKKYPKHFADIISGDTDAETSDILLQCSLFGEVIYG